MSNTKVFKNGRSQAVRIPKEFRFNEDEVFINKVGDVVVIMPQQNPYSGMFMSLDMFTDDFMKDGREQ